MQSERAAMKINVDGCADKYFNVHLISPTS